QHCVAIVELEDGARKARSVARGHATLAIALVAKHGHDLAPWHDTSFGNKFETEDADLYTNIPGASGYYLHGRDDPQDHHGYHEPLATIPHMIRDYVSIKEPMKFGIYHTLVAYQTPVTDLKAWDEMAEMLHRSFGTSSSRPFYVDPAGEDPVRPNPDTKEDTARAAFLMFADGSRAVEVEDLNLVQQPKQRFAKAVRYAILAYGDLLEDDAGPQPDAPPEVPVAGLPTDVSFPGLAATVPVEVRAASLVAVQTGNPSDLFLQAIRKLRVEADIFYTRDLRGRSVIVLGVVALERIWLRPFGLMTQIVVDPDGTFQGAFEERLRSHGVLVSYCAADAHWQIGQVERQNAFLRTVLEKMTETFAATDVDQMQLILAPSLRAVNSMVLTRGRSAYQAVFGRVPRLPGGLFTDGFALANTPTTDAAASAEIVRSEAIKAISELNTKQSLRRALLRKTRHVQVADLQPGQPCAYWRWRKRGIKKRGGWVTAKFLSWDPSSPGKLAWVRSGTSTAMVAIEQLRVATGFEAWVPTEEEVTMLKDAAKSLDQTLWSDDTGPPPPERQLQDEPVDVDLELLDSTTPELVAANVAAPPTPPPGPQQEQCTAGYFCATDATSNFGTTDSQSSPASKTTSGHSSGPGDHNLCHTSLQTHFRTQTKRAPTTPVTDSLSSNTGENLLPAKRPFDALVSLFYEDGNTHRCSPGDSLDQGFGPRPELFYQAYLSSPHRQDDVHGTTKAEIPWRKILEMDTASIEVFKKATLKEAQSWKDWGSVKELSHEEAQRVLKDKILSRRILRTRSCFRDKSRGLTELMCRVVALGHKDPAGHNKEFCDTGLAWKAWSGDASTAFLQGDISASERDQPLYLLPPTDGITAMTDCWKAPLYLVCTNIYGLSNAPRLWSLTVISRLKEVGYRQHSFDKMVFLKFHGDQLVSMIIVYVDDFIGTYREDYDITEVTNAFRWGALQEFEIGKTVTFKGKQLTLKARPSGRILLHVCQREFIEGLTPGKIPRGSNMERHLTVEERAEFRSVAGCLQWLSGQCRPELAAVNSLANHGANTTLGDLRDLYQAVDFARETKDHGFIIPDVPVNKATVILAYSDASWANAEESRSQCGVLITLCSAAVLQKTVPAMVVDWKSSRSQRVCRSTLAAESCAADEACDRSAYVNMFLGELLYSVPAQRVGSRMHNISVTDAKSLYDVVVSDSPNLSDKRSLVNIRAIQEVVSAERFHWIPTSLMWADALTKQSLELQLSMHDWLQEPTAALKQ
ncbi:RE2, partial [Symbiodinium necroappetens]